jgi:hypothetical protein
MMDQVKEIELKGVYVLGIIVWSGFVMSVFLYGIFVFLNEYKIIHLQLLGQENIKNFMITGLAILSVVEIFMCSFLQKMLRNPDKIAKNIKFSSDTGTTIGKSLQTSLIIGMAFRESIVLYGLFLYFMYHCLNIYLYFSCAGLILLLMDFPSFNSWKDTAEEVFRRLPDAKIV